MPTGIAVAAHLFAAVWIPGALPSLRPTELEHLRPVIHQLIKTGDVITDRSRLVQSVRCLGRNCSMWQHGNK